MSSMIEQKKLEHLVAILQKAKELAEQISDSTSSTFAKSELDVMRYDLRKMQEDAVRLL